MSLSRSLFVRRAETVRRFRGLKPGTFQMGAGAKVVADDCTVVTKPSEVDTRQPVTIASSANVEQCEVFVTIMVLSIISSLEASLERRFSRYNRSTVAVPGNRGIKQAVLPVVPGISYTLLPYWDIPVLL